MSDNGDHGNGDHGNGDHGTTGPAAVRRIAARLLAPRIQLAVDLAAARDDVTAAEAARRAAVHCSRHLAAVLDKVETDSRAAYAQLYERCRAAAWSAADLREMGCEPAPAGRGAPRSGRRRSTSGSDPGAALAAAPDMAPAAHDDVADAPSAAASS